MIYDSVSIDSLAGDQTMTDQSQGTAANITTIPEGKKYELKIYHTWRGRFIRQEEVLVSEGKIQFVIPILRIQGSHSNYVGQDIGFLLTPK
jgi:hypothetical protein